MSNHKMTVTFFNVDIIAHTDGGMVSLNDVFNAGNAYRLTNGKPALQINSFLNSKGLDEYLDAASDEWNLPKDGFIKTIGKGKNTKRMVHLSVALLAAEQLSPRFHAFIHKTFIEGKLLEFRDRGATEFSKLNASIDQYLPGRDGKSNKGVFIQSAKLIRAKILGTDAKTEDWNSSTVDQTYLRYEIENKLCEMLRLGVVNDYEHLKKLIEKI